MSVGKIALGVFLGNLAFAMVAWLVISFQFQEMRKQALYDSINTQAAALNTH